MNNMYSQDQYLSLCKEIEGHDYRYYVLHDPKISDYEYDMMMQQLLAIEESHPEWKVSWSPSQRLGDRASGNFPVIEHIHPMLSIANGYSLEELREFFGRIEKTLGYTPVYTLELKVDGIAVAIRYENGVLVQALSRGNGQYGEDITANIRTIRSLPLRISHEVPSSFEIRGEVFLTRENFEKINESQKRANKPEFANPRNAAGGSLKLLSSKETAQRNLQLSVYGLLAKEGAKESHYDNLMLCQAWGFPVLGMPRKCKSLDEIIQFLDEIEQIRPNLPMDIDGVVIKVDNVEAQKILGMTAKHYRWALAYKYAAERGETVLEDISVQVGRTGVLTPVAILRPIFLSGSRVSRASLYNEEEIERRDIRIGDVVYVEKGGEIIPKVVGVCLNKRPEHAQPWTMPDHCPVCQSKVIRESDRVSVRCINPSCAAGMVEKIRFFVGKGALDIDHLGDKVIMKLFELGVVKKCSDIFRLTEQDLLLVPGFKNKSVKNILESIEKAKTSSLDRFITALGIPYVGAGGATSLVQHFESLEEIMEASLEELKSIKGIGDKVAKSIVTYFSQEENIEEIRAMQRLGVNIASYQQNVSASCAGKTFVITGSLSQLSRSDVEGMIRQHGGKVSSSVSKNTDYVVVGESPGSKFKKAQDLNIPIINEGDLLNLFKN